MIENWKPVLGYEGRYEVSDIGNVRSLNFARRVGHVKQLSLVEVRGQSRGYLHVLLYDGSGRKMRPVHQLVAEAFVGARPTGMQVNHKDADRKNNAAINLEWVTGSENIKQAVRMGHLVARLGEQHKGAKLSEKEVREIIALKTSGYGRSKLARIYGVSKGAIDGIVDGVNWRHVSDAC